MVIPPSRSRASVIPPSSSQPHPLSVEVDALTVVLAPHFQTLHPVRNLAIWRLPALPALAAFHAAHALARVPVLLNDRWTPTDVAVALSVVPCVFVLTDTAGAKVISSTLHNICSPAPIILSLSRCDTALPQYTAHSILPPITPLRFTQPPDWPRSTPAAIFFTSGTTATPKAVPLTEDNLNVQSRAKHNILKLSSSTRYLHVAPLFHVGGFSSAHATTLIGGTHIFHTTDLRITRAIDARHILQRAILTNVSLLVVVPTMLRLLLDTDTPPVLSVCTVLYGAAALPVHMIVETRSRFPRARIVGAYGMTETASSMSFLCHDDFADGSSLHTSAGWPPPHVEMRVVRDDSDNVFDDGVGELETRGPHVMAGYIGAARVAEMNDGWFRTGDLGSIGSDGVIRLVGRVHDVIRSAGEKVLASEVEAALVELAFVRDVAVVGLPHRVLGEAVAAAVVLADGMRGGEGMGNVLRKGILEACRGLAAYKRPKWVFEEPDLPRNAAGKVVKERVRARLQRRIKPVSRL